MELWYFNSNDKWSNVAAQVADLLQCPEQQVKKCLLNLSQSNNNEPLSLIQQLATRLHDSEKLATVLAQENKQLTNMLVKQQQQMNQQAVTTLSAPQPATSTSYDIFTRRSILLHTPAAEEQEDDATYCSPLSTSTTATSEAYFSQGEDCNGSCDFSGSDNCSAVDELPQQDDTYSCNSEYNTCTCDELVQDDVETETTAPAEDEADALTDDSDNDEIIGANCDLKNDKYELYEESVLATSPTSSIIRTKGKKMNKNVRFEEASIVPQLAGTSTKQQQENSSQDLLLRKQKQQSKFLRSAVNR